MIVQLISHDPAKPTSRATLCALTGLSDRRVRLEIAAARRRGVWIVPARGGGYYVTEDAAAWNAFCSQQRRRALSTLGGSKAARVEEPGQLSL